MRIIINGINYHPELTGIGKYTGEMAEWLVENGHEVLVITAPPYYPSWKVSDGYSSFLYKREDINGVKVIRCPLWVPAKPSGLNRLVHLSSFAISSIPIMLWKSLTVQPDIVFVVEPPFFCSPMALVSAKLGRAKSWLHVQDFEIDAAFNLGMLKSERLKSWVAMVESWLMKKFDTVSTISTRMLERLESKGVATTRCQLFENWVEIDSIYPMIGKSPLYQQLKLPENCSIILYSGNMGEKQGLELILEAADRLKDRHDLLFLLCGNGSSRERLQTMSASLDNVMFLPLQPLSKLNDLLNLADVHLLPQKPGAEDLVMPSKLTNMMASGRPVVATAAKNTQIAKVLSGCGIVVEPGDSEAFCNAIKTLVDDTDEARKLGNRSREYAVEHWNKHDVLSNIFSQELTR